MTKITLDPVFLDLGGYHGDSSPVPLQLEEVRSRLYRLELYLRRLAMHLTGGDAEEYPDPFLTSGEVTAGVWLEGGGDLKDGPVNIDLSMDRPLLVRGDGSDSSEYSTITAALAASTSGDLVLLPALTYAESVTIPTGVSLCSLAARRATITGSVTLGGHLSSLVNVTVTRTVNSTAAEVGVRGPTTIGAQGIISHCMITGSQAGTGSLYGIHIEGGHAWLHDTQVHIQGNDAIALYVNGTYDVGGATPIVKDWPSGDPISEGTWHVFTATCPPTSPPDVTKFWDCTVESSVEAYTYVGFQWTGFISCEKYWGDDATPKHIHMVLNPFGGEAWTFKSGVWGRERDETEITTTDEISTLGGDGYMYGRVKDTTCNLSFNTQIGLMRTLTNGYVIAKMRWFEYHPESVVADDCSFHGSEYDILVVAGGVTLQACTYDHNKASGLITAASGDRSAWDVSSYADLHASDIDAETPLYHWTAAELAALLPPVTLDANADTVLSLTAQELGLDTQVANRVFAGPASGADAVPTVRALVTADMPAGTIAGSGTAGRVTEWLDTTTLQASTLIKSGAGVLTLSAAGAYQLTVAAAASVAGTNAGDVSLAASADELLGITAQALSLDSKAVGLILAGPLSGAAAAPTFKALGHVAVSAGFGKLLFNAADGLLLLGPGCPRTPTAWDTLRVQRATLSGAYHEVAGRWPESRALVVEPAATNYILYPRMVEYGVTGLATGWIYGDTFGSGGNATLDVVPHPITERGWMQRLTYTATAGDSADSAYINSNTAVGSFVQGNSVTISVDVKGTLTGCTLLIQVYEADAASVLGTGHWSGAITISDMIKRAKYTFTCADADCSRLLVFVMVYQIDSGDYLDVYAGAVNVEKTAPATTFIAGSLGVGYTWSGTADASTSTRAATVVNLDAHAAMLSDRNTVTHSVWVQAQYDADDANWPSGTSGACIIDYRGADDNNRAILRFQPTNNTIAVYLNGADRLTSAVQTFKAGDWLHIVMTLDYTNDLYKLYLNGVLIDSDTTALTAPTGLVDWILGTVYNGGAGYYGGWIYGEYAVFGRILTANEVAADFALGRPLTDAGALATPVVNGYGIRLPVSYNNVSDPPTDAELTAAFGWQADGFTALLDDAGAATKTWKVWRASTAWWYEELTKAT